MNNEYEVLYTFLEKLPHVLAPGGRAAILTFHSGEDRLVKKSFKRFQDEGLYREIAREVIRPSAEECSRNSRARCTRCAGQCGHREKSAVKGRSSHEKDAYSPAKCRE